MAEILSAMSDVLTFGGTILGIVTANPILTFAFAGSLVPIGFGVLHGLKSVAGV